MIALLLLGCIPGSVKLDDTGAPEDTADTAGESGDTASDSAEETGGDTGGDTGNDTGGDSGDDTGDDTGAAPTWDLQFLLDEGAVGAAFNLYAATTDAEGVVLGDRWLAREIDHELLALDVDPPDASLLYEIDPVGHPGLLAAWLVPTVHTDTSGDLVHDDGEVFLGVGEVWALYLVGPLGEDYRSYGLVEGWNALPIGEDADAVGDPLAIPVPLNLVPVESVTLAGSYAGPTEVGTLRLASVPYVAFELGALPPLGYDAPLANDWAATLTGRPAAEALYDLDGSGALADPEVLLTYQDTDGSGAFELTDRAFYLACDAKNVPVGPMWVEPPAALELAVNFALVGIPTGWFAIRYDDGGTFSILDEAARVALRIDEDCGG